MEEHREAVRHKSFIQGRVCFNHSRSSMDCIIREFAPDRARLEFSEPDAGGSPSFLSRHLHMQRRSVRPRHPHAAPRRGVGPHHAPHRIVDLHRADAVRDRSFQGEFASDITIRAAVEMRLIRWLLDLAREIGRHSGIETIDRIANAITCICHDIGNATETTATTIAARPSHIMKTPGMSNSSRKKSALKMNQFQAPSDTIHSAIIVRVSVRA